MSLHEDLRQLLVRAAVCDQFDPQALVRGSPKREDLLRELAQQCTEVVVGNTVGWRLTRPARLAALSTVRRDELRRVLERGDQADGLSRGFSAVLMLRKSRSVEIEARLRAAELLHQSWPSLGDSVGYSQQVRLLRIELARQSAALSLAESLRSPLRGRDALLRLLRGFANSGAEAFPKNLQADFGAKVHGGLFEERRWPKVPALLISGIGGIGKSALLAELIRCERGRGWKGRVVVHFDFDQPGLKGGEQGAMTLHLARQLELARPKLEPALAPSCGRLRALLSDLDRSPNYDAFKVTLHAELSSWKKPLRQQGVQDLLVVLDTLEEVTSVDFSRLIELFNWLESVRVGGGLEKIAVVASGRALTAPGQRDLLWPYFLTELELGDLPSAAACALFRDRLRHENEILSAHLVSDCVGTFGANPLVLCILARYCAGQDAQALTELLRDARSKTRETFGGEFAQKFLYSRILERVRDTSLRALASPGLVLRRVTPTLLREVLAGPCGLGAVDETHAEDLLARLRRLVWLVIPDDEGVRHRRDVRRLMLPAIWQRDHDQARAICRAAKQWFTNVFALTNSGAAKCEADYHAAFLGELGGGASELSALAVHLGEDVDDLPISIRSQVKFHGGKRLDAAEESALPLQLRRAMMQHRRRVLAAEGVSKSTLGAGRSADQSQESAQTRLERKKKVRARVAVNDEAESVRAIFFEGRFDEVAFELEPLLRRLWARIGSESWETRWRVTEDPVYFAAICLKAFHPEKCDRLAFFARRYGQLVGRLVPQSVLSLLLVLDRVLWRTPDLCHKYKFFSRLAQSDTAPDWQSAIAQIRAARAAFKIVPLRELPFLSPQIFELLKMLWEAGGVPGIGRGQYIATDILARWRIAMTEQGDVGWSRIITGLVVNAGSNEFSRRPQLKSVSSFSGVEALRAELSSCFVAIDVRECSRLEPSSCLGLMSEIYAPLRTILREEFSSSELLAQCVRSLNVRPQIWPRELSSAQLGSCNSDRLNELMPSLIAVTDYCGRLGDLIEMVAHLARFSTTSQMRHVRELYETLSSVWSADFQD